jgi:Trypsin-like peptidase domain
LQVQRDVPLLLRGARHHISHVLGCSVLLAITYLVLLEGCCADCADLSRVGAVSYVGPAVDPISGSDASEQAPGNGQLTRVKVTSGRPATSSQPAELSAGSEAVASGFYVDNQGHLLTVWAQVRNCPKLAVLDDYEFRPAALVDANPLSGLALLRVPAPKNVHPVFRGKSLTNGERVSAFSYPIVDGLIMPIDVVESSVRAATSPDGVMGVFELGSPLDGRAAGGPIIDHRGDIAGIAVPRLNANWPGDRAYGIAAAPMLQFLSAAGVRVSTRDGAGAGNILPDQDAASYAGDYTSPVICSH